MNKLKHFLLGWLLFALASNAAGTDGTWLGSSHGLLGLNKFGATVTSLFAVNDGSLFAVGNNTYVGTLIYRSQDKGETWKELTEIRQGGFSRTLVTANGTILIGTYYGGIYKSTDNGQTWSRSTEGLDNFIVTFLVEDSDGILYGYCESYLANGAQAKIIRSTDQGNTWQPYDVIPVKVSLRGSPFSEISGIPHISVNSGVLKSADLGKTWEYARFGERQFSWLFKKSNGTLFVASYNSYPPAGEPADNVFRSTDNGLTWQPIGKELVEKTFTRFTEAPDGTLYGIAGINTEGVRTDRIYRSRDDGTTWTPLETSGVRETQIVSMMVTADNTLYIGLYQGGVQRLETAANVNNASDADRVFNWAEAIHPETFPRGPLSQSLSGYTVRFYPASGIYLGARNDRLYVHDGKLLNLLDVGALGDFAAKAKAAGY